MVAAGLVDGSGHDLVPGACPAWACGGGLADTPLPAFKLYPTCRSRTHYEKAPGAGTGVESGGGLAVTPLPASLVYP